MTKNNQHLVFDIKRFAVHDGPGIRTTVFLKGCTLHCPWCHNPEGLIAKKQLQFYTSSCIQCHHCVDVCPEQAVLPLGKKQASLISIDRDQCNHSGECVQACPSQALKFDSQYMTPEMVLEEVLKDKIFYETSNGGVTFSGGDPLFNHTFLLQCIKLCKQQNLHVAIETALMKEWGIIEQLIDEVDLFIVDLKIYDDQEHDKIVGGSGELIKDNIQKLNELQENILLRTPLIPGYTTSKKNLRQIGEFYQMLACKNQDIKLELLNNNPYAVSKYENLGIIPDKLLSKKKFSENEMNSFYKIVRGKY